MSGSVAGLSIHAVPGILGALGRRVKWPMKFISNEDQEKQIVTSDLLRLWVGIDLDTEALPHGPLTPLLQYQVNLRPYRYTALTTDGRLIAVVDKSELATRTTGELLCRQLA